MKKCNKRHTTSPSTLYAGRPCNTQCEAGATGETGASERSGEMPCGRRRDQARFRDTRKALRREREPRAGQVMQAHFHPHFSLPLAAPPKAERRCEPGESGQWSPQRWSLILWHTQVDSETDISDSLGGARRAAMSSEEKRGLTKF